MWMTPRAPLITQQWHQGRWFDEGFQLTLMSKVSDKVFKRHVLLSATTMVQDKWVLLDEKVTCGGAY